MQNFKSKLTTVRTSTSDWFKRNGERLVNILTILAFTAGIIALAALVWLYVRPIQVADIKVPVATDQASYHPGEEISGIFFGEIIYRGEVRVLREVFCKDYTNIIAPPPSARNGDFYDTQSIPRKIEGLSVNIGMLPTDIPVGSNCVLQFTNVYSIQTPFGLRHVEYQYYTQNFSIVTKERRLQLECEATGRKDCNFLGESPTDLNDQPERAPMPQESVDSAQDTRQPQNVFNDNRSSTTNNTTNTTNPAAESEPAPKFVERCTVDLLGVRIGCRLEHAE